MLTVIALVDAQRVARAVKPSTFKFERQTLGSVDSWIQAGGSGLRGRQIRYSVVTVYYLGSGSSVAASVSAVGHI